MDFVGQIPGLHGPAHVSYLVLMSGLHFIPGLWVVLFVPAVDEANECRNE